MVFQKVYFPNCSALVIIIRHFLLYLIAVLIRLTEFFKRPSSSANAFVLVAKIILVTMYNIEFRISLFYSLAYTSDESKTGLVMNKQNTIKLSRVSNSEFGLT